MPRRLDFHLDGIIFDFYPELPCILSVHAQLYGTCGYVLYKAIIIVVFIIKLFVVVHK